MAEFQWNRPDQSDMGVGGNSWTALGSSEEAQAAKQNNPFTRQMQEWNTNLAAAPKFGSGVKILSAPNQKAPYYTIDDGGVTKYVVPYRGMVQDPTSGMGSDSPYAWTAPGGMWGTKAITNESQNPGTLYNAADFSGFGPGYESARVLANPPRVEKWVTPKESSIFEDFSPLLTIGGAFAGAGALGSGGLGNFLSSFGGTGAGGAGTPAWWDFGSGVGSSGSIPGGASTLSDIWQNIQNGGVGDIPWGNNLMDLGENSGFDLTEAMNAPGFDPVQTLSDAGIDWNSLGSQWEQALGASGTQNAALSGPGGFLKALMNNPQMAMQTLGQLPGSTLQGLFGGNSSTGSYSFPFGKVLGGLLESYGANKKQNSLESSLKQALSYADPFHNQRPWYQRQFADLTENPSNFFKNSAIKSAIDFEDQATNRKLAGQGYNMSGNFAEEVAQARMREAFKQYIPYTDMIGTAAGYKLGTGNSGSIAANMAPGIAQGEQQVLGGPGSALQSLLTGQQPSYLEQLYGASPNQNLAQLFMQGLA